ncbi:MAG: peptide chain release factor N(5)-glutamine methyltransferase [Clostridium sp.]|nr:peptide chain release factor N(5)-glutamine methyltransferase [Clostridium sp.]
MNLKQAYSYAVQFLEANHIDEADFKALCIVCHLAGIKNSEYEQNHNAFINMKKLADMLWRVKSDEPLQYVIGKWDFYESEFYVGEGVLIPRPETEELVELAVKSIKSIGNCVVYDLCAGSGCIGISVAKACPDAMVYMVEKSEQALFYLNKNADGICNVKVIQGDIHADMDLPDADVIISNPPYIKTSDISDLQAEVLKEPVMALDGGSDGLDFYRIINNNWYTKLKPEGRLFLEIGEEQGESIIPVLNHFENIKVLKDLYGNDRMVTAVCLRS